MKPHRNIVFNFFMCVSLFRFIDVGIEITQIIPFKDSGELKCDVLINDLFSNDTRSLLMSGIPIHLIISSKVLDNHKKQLSTNEAEIKIDYDVWNETFSVQYHNSHIQLHSFDSLRSTLRTIKAIPLASLARLNEVQTFYVFMNIRTYNDQSNQIIDSIVHESANKKFSLGSIIRFFFGSSDGINNWYHSEKFSLSELPFRNDAIK